MRERTFGHLRERAAREEGVDADAALPVAVLASLEREVVAGVTRRHEPELTEGLSRTPPDLNQLLG